ncbi:zinc finger, C2H2 type [Dictyocaulus viviparus]|uniref:Zinc finger, C2H2 type n=1 Tax=Dictyocaulus viviparus TaxID=29172 RepID=A0A0D8XMU8_DICVI|nr:zinc finger, C2H2 type [Dictyocaulus viviparus]
MLIKLLLLLKVVYSEVVTSEVNFILSDECLKNFFNVVLRNLRPYKCEQCGTEFGRAGGLRRHDSMVHQQKKHACPYEGCKHPGYKCTKALAAHIRSVHTLDRPFSCLFCDRTFVRKNDLKVHELTHSTQCEFLCNKCNSSFRRLIYLQKHEKRCSGGLKRRRLNRVSGTDVYAPNSQLVNSCDSDESMTRVSSEFDYEEQLLSSGFSGATGDESLEEVDPLIVIEDDNLEICDDDGIVKKECPEIVDDESLEEGEIDENQTSLISMHDNEQILPLSIDPKTASTPMLKEEQRINFGWLSRKNLRFEPREEAVVPKKRRRCSFASLSTFSLGKLPKKK